MTGENKRLVYVRAMATLAPFRVRSLVGPFRLETSGTFTLVLPGRDSPYTLADLLALAPDTLIRQPEGSYFLTENLVVLTGATLALDAPEGISLRLKSDPASFVSIVTLGGSLSVSGSAAAAATITSWDPALGAPDTITSDGRAYIRAIGGHTDLTHAHIANLGFWGGNTGGLAFTGTDPSNIFDSSIGSGTPGAGTIPNGAPVVAGADLAKISEGAGEQHTLASATVDHVTVTGNAYGIFASNAHNLTVDDTQITGSLIDGLALHQSVTETTISNTTSTYNYGDGFSLDRSSSNALYHDDISANNGRDGFNIDGQPLALGPGPAGFGTEGYGGNRIVNSTITGNTRNGIEISGGQNVEVTASSIAGNEDGILVDHGAANVQLTNNTLQDQRNRGITIRDAGTSSTVTGNTISGGDTGVSLRNSAASVTANVVAGITNHGMALQGDTSQSHITDNTVSGTGSTAIWSETTAASSGDSIVGNNDVRGWHPAPTLATVTNWVFQPLTFVWLFLATLLVGSAVTRKRHLQLRSIHSPFPEQAQPSRNIATREGTKNTEHTPVPARRLP
ncbi:right-handed parallel beta-helix repeat-containing protein [Cryobacterium sp. 10C3]|uniref:right-handed parallel beta-helix repeat-containing protein n=1 Tax=Cryobacterium sp. 10C3 TaxID=3048577 RepID=UPI002AB36573|nr:right-handed parallel beta-helix repeat-containing protein [Cryobacterium sp. 10C3]MDY7555841.1 right-handed parallel beta-helix repeat-containing protein [Cryobacterium sp. 10C3]MEB0000230.1 right-handed parallel beta-helix repeat-containing protein [Cryobacterium sp. RTS3]